MNAAVRWVVGLGFALPAVGYGAARLSGPDGLLQVVLLGAAFFAMPLGFALLRGGGGDRGPAGDRAEEMLAFGAALVFALPLVPVVLHVLPMEFERALLHGTFAALWWSGGVRRALCGWRGAQGPAALAVWLLLVWAVGSVASAVYALWSALPLDYPFGAELLRSLWTDGLVPRSALEPGYPVRALALRLEWLFLVALGLGLSLERGDRGRALLEAAFRASSAALLLGFAMAWSEMARAAYWRGESLFARVAAGLGRMHRPLLDNNALGSALLVWLPLALAGAVGVFLRRSGGAPRLPRAALFFAALCAGAFLLTTSRSKAALAGFGLFFAFWVLATFGARRAFSRAWIWIPAAALGLLFAAVQWVPLSTLGEFAKRSRYAEDFVRIARLEYNTAYLRENRSAPWLGAMELTLDKPLVGHGLGSFPRALGQVHDPERKVAFNPRHENAHNQVLQWAAEEGLGAALLGLALWALAVIGAWRSASRARAMAPGGLDREALLFAAPAAALFGLFANSMLGHPWLETGAAIPIGLLFAIGLGALSGSGRKPGRWVWYAGPAAALLLPLAAVPFAERPSRVESTFGCFPWAERERAQPPRDRLLAQQAGWVESWGSGERMLMPVRDVRPFGFGEPLVIDLWLDDQWVIRGQELPMARSARESAPVGWLKADRPAGVERGQEVVVRIAARPPYAETLQFSTGRFHIGPRAGQITFVDPR